MTYCSVVTVLALVGLTKKHFGHYAILTILSLRSPRHFKVSGTQQSTVKVIVYCFRTSFSTA